MLGLSVKEFGSDFDYCSEAQWLLKPGQVGVFNTERFQLFASGRSALWALLAQGIAQKQWQRVYLPSYYCHEVGQFLQTLNIDVQTYAYNPWDNNPVDTQKMVDATDSVIVSVDYFGLVKPDVSTIKHAVKIDDITHNILAFETSNADYCFASLRKELPVPVGGYCYSPKTLALPAAKICLKAEKLCLKKLAAMFLKQQYLAGTFTDKPSFRAMLLEAEQALACTDKAAAMPSAAKALLKALDVTAMLQAKQNNIAVALQCLAKDLPVTVNFNQCPSGFGLLLKLNDSEQTQSLKQHLLAQNIYPAVLWPEQKNVSDQKAMHTMLMLHMDYRYSADDIVTICQIINEYFYGK